MCEKSIIIEIYFLCNFVWKPQKNVIPAHLIRRVERHEMTQRFPHYPIKSKESRWESETLACAHLNETITRSFSQCSEQIPFIMSQSSETKAPTPLKVVVRLPIVRNVDCRPGWLFMMEKISHFSFLLSAYMGFSIFVHVPRSATPSPNAAQNSSSSLDVVLKYKHRVMWTRTSKREMWNKKKIVSFFHGLTHAWMIAKWFPENENMIFSVSFRYIVVVLGYIKQHNSETSLKQRQRE